MTLRLSVDRTAWLSHVADVAESLPGLVPVVKGNGYGFGRAPLHIIAATLSPYVCVGSVYELDHLVPGVRPIVLTPATVVPNTVDEHVVLTVGSVADVHALGDWGGQVMVKLCSSMRRYGASPDELGDVFDAVAASGRSVFAVGIHLPLAGDDDQRRAEIDAWLVRLPAEVPLWVSHLGTLAWADLRRDYPARSLLQRVGSRLWHGSKSFLRLRADVSVVRPVRAGEIAGYRATPVPSDG
ncbi:MAG TPA: alanine racemase, partial [Ilumatobacteraceae bacterium]|nr:alanine racemase [Ilumatobacteraceae bacterium]